MSWDERFLLDLSDSISLGSSEKRATSEPEIMAERPRKMTKARSPERVLIENGKNSICPNKAPTDATKLVSKLDNWVFKMEGHPEYLPDRCNLQVTEVRRLLS